MRRVESVGQNKVNKLTRIYTNNFRTGVAISSRIMREVPQNAKISKPGQMSVDQMKRMGPFIYMPTVAERG
jgi:hypothetical protein